MSDTKTMSLFLQISQQRMCSHYLPKLVESIKQLDSTMLWNREMEHLNSIGGIVFHICEHIRRNSIRLSTSTNAVFSKGIEDHFPDLHLTPEELIQAVIEVFDEFKNAVDSLLLHMTDEIDMHSLYHLVEHTGYHLGQIVDRVQRITCSSFKFCQNGINEQNLKALIEE